MTTLPAESPTARPFRPTHCLDCGYSLEGLPAAGICPECGTAYRDDLLVLWGWPASRGGNLQRMRKRPLWGRWGLVLPVVFVVYLAAQGAWLGAGILLILFSLPTIWYFRQLHQGYSKPPHPMQGRLSPEGVGQRLGYGAVKLNPWPSGVIIQLRRPDKRPPQLNIHTETLLGAVSRHYCVMDLDVQEADWPVLVAWLTERAGAVGGKIRYTDG
jgi:hypothetical protein